MSGFSDVVNTNKISVRTIITTAIIFFCVLFLINFVKRDEIIIRDNNGNQTGTGEVKSRFGVKNW